MLDTFLRIQELGVRIVFDDFGTGYASLSYLKKFPLDGLKIDRSFVLELLANPDDAAIVSSTIGLSKQLGLSVIAEGIENRRHRRSARRPWAARRARAITLAGRCRSPNWKSNSRCPCQRPAKGSLNVSAPRQTRRACCSVLVAQQRQR